MSDIRRTAWRRPELINADKVAAERDEWVAKVATRIAARLDEIDDRLERELQWRRIAHRRAA